MDIARDEVRVMTVHGAKGLEAPIVILADTTTVPKGPREPRMVPLPVAKAAPGTPDRLVWAGRKADDPEPVATARAAAVRAAEDEHRRLLYVAMTRAADRLVDRGLARREPHPAGLLVRARERRAQAGRGRGSDGRRRGLALAQGGAGDRSQARRVCRTATRHDVPEWLHEAVPSETARAARDLAVARARGRRKPTRRRSRAAASCTGCCRRCPRCRRSAAAKRRAGPSRAPEIERGEGRFADEVLKLLDDPRFAALFAPGSRAEVPIVGILADGRQVSGQADRLAITSKDVLIADYKSNRIVPDGIERDSAATTSRNLRSTAPCCARSIRITRCARRWCGPPDRPSRSCPRSRSTPQCQGFPRRKTPSRDGALTLRGRVHSFRHPTGACARKANQGARAAHQPEIQRCAMGVSKVSDADFDAEVLKSSQPVVVDFWAEWCGPCKQIAPALDEIAGAMNGKVKIVKLNVDENPATAAKYGIMSIPTLMLFKNGELASRQVGAAPKQKLEQWITSSTAA